MAQKFIDKNDHKAKTGPNYFTVYLDDVDVQSIEALAGLCGYSIPEYLKYRVIMRGIVCCLSKTDELGQQWVERLQKKQERKRR